MLLKNGKWQNVEFYFFQKIHLTNISKNRGQGSLSRRGQKTYPCPAAVVCRLFSVYAEAG